MSCTRLHSLIIHLINYRKFRASWRDTLILFREFRFPLLGFLVLLLGGGSVYYFLAKTAGQPLGSIPEAVYLALTLTFLQSNGDFPDIWYLQFFYFAFPAVGISLLAQGLTEFGIMFFNRRARSKEWEMAIASTFSDHIILVGLGHLGFRVVKILHDMEQDIVIITTEPKSDLLEKIHDMDIPILVDDATRDAVLDSAGIRKASSIILCTQNDSINLQIALKARALNPKIEVVVRIFDDDFAQSLQQQFGFRALTATGMAAPVFAASAAQMEITPPIMINDEPISLAGVNIQSTRLAGYSIEQVEKKYQITIASVSRDGRKNQHPDSNFTIQKNDLLMVTGNPNSINLLVHDNRL